MSSQPTNTGRGRFTDADEWYRFFDRKEFLLTNHMRSWVELDWTPEPDMFDDIFGHLPFFMLPAYAALLDMFVPTYGSCLRQLQGHRPPPRPADFHRRSRASERVPVPWQLEDP